MVAEELKDLRIVQALEARDGTLLSGVVEHGETTLEIAGERIVEVCRVLRDDYQFVRLSSVTATDWYPLEPRFHVVYHLHSLGRNERLRLKCKLAGDAAEIDSVIAVWGAADWYEREVFDLFGVRFRNHPNLIRILMPPDWTGHPLRKDFPVHGHKYSYKDE